MENYATRTSQRLLRTFRCGSVMALLSHIVEGTLMCAIGLLVWYTGSSLHHPSQAHDLPRRIATPEAERFDITPLINAHLFGVPPSATITQASPPPADIHLIGVVASADPAVSSAIVSENGETHTWHVGDTLPDGSVLDAIDSNSISLRRGANDTLISFDIRPAPLDAHFDTLTLETIHQASGLESSDSAAAVGHSQPQAPGNLQSDSETQLKTLRAQALQVMMQRLPRKPYKSATHPALRARPGQP